VFIVVFFKQNILILKILNFGFKDSFLFILKKKFVFLTKNIYPYNKKIVFNKIRFVYKK